MKKTEWERKIVDLKEQQFKEVRARNEASGLCYAQAAIAAYKAVYVREGK